MLATCQLSASFCYHAEFQEVCYQKQENGRFVAGSRHGMCESGFNTAGERHGMCESAFTVSDDGRFNHVTYNVYKQVQRSNKPPRPPYISTYTPHSVFIIETCFSMPPH